MLLFLRTSRQHFLPGEGLAPSASPLPDVSRCFVTTDGISIPLSHYFVRGRNSKPWEASVSILKSSSGKVVDATKYFARLTFCKQSAISNQC